MAGCAGRRVRGRLVAADLAVRGATVVGTGAIRALDILIENDRISALVEPGASAADEEIDARGLFALPGIVDAHVHFNEPGREQWEGWEHGSRAAAAGGVTTVCDMPLNSIPPTLDGASFEAKRAAAQRSSIVDFALWGGLVPGSGHALGELKDAGAIGVKAFLCDSGVPEFPALADDELVPALAHASEAGLLVAVHAEDAATVAEATARVRAGGSADPAAWTASRPALAEVRAVARACDAAALTAARLHVVHLSAADALGAIGLARERGVDVSVETCAHYLTFDDADVAAQGPLLKCAPPIRDSAAREALWSALLGGRIDLVASDHSPSSADLKRGDDVFAAWGGVSGVQSLLPAVMTEALRRSEGLGLDRVAGFIAWRLSAKPAQRLGLWPRKGAIAVGADADITLVDAGREWTLARDQVQTRSGLTPYVDRTFHVVVRRTIVRGRTVFRDGVFPSPPGWGRLARP